MIWYFHNKAFYENTFYVFFHYKVLWSLQPHSSLTRWWECSLSVWKSSFPLTLHISSIMSSTVGKFSSWPVSRLIWRERICGCCSTDTHCSLMTGLSPLALEERSDRPFHHWSTSICLRKEQVCLVVRHFFPQREFQPSQSAAPSSTSARHVQGFDRQHECIKYLLASYEKQKKT